MQRLLSNAFESVGAQVRAVSNAAQAIDLASEHHFDVLVLDALPPDDRVAQLPLDLARVAVAGARPLIVLYSASVRRYQSRHGCIPETVDAFIVKDDSGNGLVRKVQELLLKRGHRDESPARRHNLLCAAPRDETLSEGPST
jgi:CheY-like chemotaxis protein